MEGVTKEDLEKAFEKVGNDASPHTKRKVQETVMKIVEGKDTKEALGITPQTEDELYKFGYELFQSGKYWPAFGCFSFLRSLEPYSYRYVFGVAASCQYMERYTEAAANYILCTNIEKLNPVPHFHLYNCFLKLNYLESAFHALLTCIELAKLNPNYTPLKEKAELESQGLKNELKKKYHLKDEVNH